MLFCIVLISIPTVYTSKHTDHIHTFFSHFRYLPLHWALAKDQPSLEVIYLLVAAYPEGLFDPDYEDHLPYDK